MLSSCCIPGYQQKSGESSVIPTIPEFARLLDSVPEEERTGYVFRPAKIRGAGRPMDKQAGRIITAIGEEAGVVVNKTGKPASAHDLRATFATRLVNSGVDPLDAKSILRHAAYQTTLDYYVQVDAAAQAKRIAKKLGTKVGYGRGSRQKVKSS